MSHRNEEPDFKLIRDCFLEALETFRIRDYCLLTNDVNERSITHKLAEYLQQKMSDLFSDFNVDCEYNRDIDAEGMIKRITRNGNFNSEGTDLDAKTVYPDIIIHKRDVNTSNLLVIEVKKVRTNHTLQILIDIDKTKLCEFTAGYLKYSYGLFLLFNNSEKKCELCWFKDGEEIPDMSEIIPFPKPSINTDL
jgi:hypothetical protein